MNLKEGIPLHKQISDWLKQEIESGALEKDEKLPSENELSEKFDVSRVTVRRALQTLENDQLIYRCQGLGSFVTDQRTYKSFSFLHDFTEELEGSGLEPSSQLISFEQESIEGRNDILTYLGIENKKVAVKIERIRLGDDEPIAYDITWMPMFYGQLIEDYDLEENTIFNILEDEYDIPIQRGCYRIEAAIADEMLADHLNVNPNDPLLQINRISYTIKNKPVYFQKRYYRSDKMVFELMTERNSINNVDEDNLPFKEFIPVFRDKD
jgi:GntR family transcriptional regulator